MEYGTMGRKRLKRHAALFLAVIVMGSVISPVRALAAEQEGTAYGETVVVEYENLRELLKAGNADLTQSYADYEANVAPYQEMWDTLKQEQKYMEDMAGSYEDDGDEEMAAFYEDNAKQLEKAAGQINVRIRNLTSESQTKSLEEAADAKTLAAQSLMNSYNQMMQNIQAGEAGAEAANAAYEEALTKHAAGTAKDSEVKEAKQSADSQNNSLASLKERAAQIKSSLLSMLGLSGQVLSGQTRVEIGTIPPPDLDKIRSIDREADKAMSISNDSALFNQRREKATGTDERELRDQKIAQAGAEAEMTYLSAYDSLMSSLNSYEAALQSYEAATLEYQALQRKKQAGMLSRTAWLEGVASYKEKEAAKEIAAMSLYQAYETYCWTVKGAGF